MMTKTKTSRQLASKLLAVLLAMLLVAVYMPTIFVGAATTSVKTLDDLKNISKDLDGTYKLAATIDCGGATLDPIGNLDAPFTGKFTCDTDSSGKPLYAITNFKVSVKIGSTSRKDQNTKYEKTSKNWGAGLFGVTKDASFKNIVLLKATVTSDVLGGSKTGASYSESYKGMDEQGTGIFAGIAVGTTFENCGVQGAVYSVANHVGGFVGQATKEVESSATGSARVSSSKGCTIKNCYAYVEANGGYNASDYLNKQGILNKNIKATDLYGWNFGGFAGSLLSTKATGCFVDGTVKCSTWMCFGGFVGKFDTKSKITACYSTGTGAGLQGPFAGVDSGLPDICTIAAACYTNLKLGGTPLAEDKTAITGSFVTLSTGSDQNNGAGDNRFDRMSVAGINKALASNSNWQTYTDGATLPTVKALTGKTIKSTADLPAGGTTPSDDGSGSGSGSGSNGDNNSSTGGADTSEEEIDDSELLAELNACKDADAIVKLFPSLDKKIAEAVLTYKTENGEFASIDDLKKVEGITDEIIETMRSDFLNDSSGTEGEESTGNGGSGTIEVIQDKGIVAMTTAEMVLIIVLSALILITLAGSVIMIILLAKKIKSLTPAEGTVEDVPGAEATADEQ